MNKDNQEEYTSLVSLLEGENAEYITFVFAGSGDSGGLDEINLGVVDYQAYDKLNSPIREEIELLFDSIADSFAGSYELNEGGGVDISIKKEDGQWVGEIASYYNSEEEQDSPISNWDGIVGLIEEQDLHNITGQFSFSYAGSGDSGEIESLDFEIASDQDQENEYELARSKMEHIAYGIMRIAHPGFEINEGGKGEFSFIINNGKVVSYEGFCSDYVSEEMDDSRAIIDPEFIHALIHCENSKDIAGLESLFKTHAAQADIESDEDDTPSIG